MDTAWPSRQRQASSRTLEVAMVRLVRAVLDPGWEPAAAASRLEELLGHNPVAVARLRARVQRAAVQHSSELTERALVTLDALAADSVT